MLPISSSESRHREVALKHRIDEIYTTHPYYGYRRIAAQLQREDLAVNPGPNLSKHAKQTAIYPICWRIPQWMRLTIFGALALLEFTRFSGNPKYEGEPITCAETTGLRERSRRGRRKLRTDQSDLNKGQTVRSRGRSLRTYVLL